MKRILVVGSINMDIVNRVRSHPRPGETVPGLGVAYHPGGKGANQAVAAAKAGSDVRMFGAVGSDAFGDTLLANLNRFGIDASLVQRVDGPSGLAFITVDAAGENTIIVAANANGALTSDHLLQPEASGFTENAVFSDVAALLVQNEVPLPVTLAAMEMARERGIQVLCNPAPVSGFSSEWLTNVDIAIVNETEAEVLTGVSFPGQAAPSSPSPDGRTLLAANAGAAKVAIAELVKRGAEAAVVTLGHDGCVYGVRANTNNRLLVPIDASRSDEGPAGYVETQEGAVSIQDAEDRRIVYIRQAAFNVEAVDTTAAGDTFAGSFAAGLVEMGDVRAALRYASAAAALSVTRSGAQPSIPARAEVLSFLDEVEAPTQPR